MIVKTGTGICLLASSTKIFFKNDNDSVFIIEVDVLR